MYCLKFISVLQLALYSTLSAVAKSGRMAENRFHAVGLSKLNTALKGYTKETTYKQSQIECHHACLARDWCQSYNYQIYDKVQNTPRYCELNNKAVSKADETGKLQVKKGSVYVQVKDKNLIHQTCVDVLRSGAMASGVYELSNKLRVFCHMSPENGSAWTLFMSQSLANKNMIEFKQKSLTINAPVSPSRPNWQAYRLPLQELVTLVSSSSHWRVTCNYDKMGMVRRDSVLYKLSNLNPFTWQGSAECKKSEYVNINGRECFGCNITCYQPSNEVLHFDTTYVPCEFGHWPLEYAADAFGFYDKIDPRFSCTSENSATTNHWLGGYL